jgi:hypothetical protein
MSERSKSSRGLRVMEQRESARDNLFVDKTRHFLSCLLRSTLMKSQQKVGAVGIFLLIPAFQSQTLRGQNTALQLVFFLGAILWL